VTITRIGTTARWSDLVIHGGVLYLVEVPSGVQGDITEQTREVLASLDESLAAAGSDRRHLLMVTIYLADITELDRFNAVWDAWVPAGSAPVRACVQAALANPGYRLELQIMAAAAGPGQPPPA
jgi:enamine deaminase RidA (YjgF/YER057c/UK114 family)